MLDPDSDAGLKQIILECEVALSKTTGYTLDERMERTRLTFKMQSAQTRMLWNKWERQRQRYRSKQK